MAGHDIKSAVLWGPALFTLGCGEPPPDDTGFGDMSAGVATTGDEPGDGSSSEDGHDEWGPGDDESTDEGESTGGAPADGSTGDAPELVACAELAAQHSDLGGGVFEVDFDGTGERPPASFACEEPEPRWVVLTLTADAYNVDLAVVLGSVALDQLDVVVPEDVTVGSYSTQQAALTTGSLPPATITTLAIAGRVQGAGGSGGFGGVCNVPSTAGQPGGVALELLTAVSVMAQFESDGAVVTGRIWGGGGGGGGGGDGCDELYCGGTGAGGGGSGSLPGGGGEAQMPVALPSLGGGGTCGDNGGTNFVGGDGTSDDGGTGANGQHGGAPGEPGAAGHPGAPSYQTTAGQPGGQPGCAFVASTPGQRIQGGDVRPATQDACQGTPR